MLAGLIAPRLRLTDASTTPWLRSPASIVARHAITLIVRLGTLLLHPFIIRFVIIRKKIYLKKSQKPDTGKKQRPDFDLAQKSTLEMIYIFKTMKKSEFRVLIKSFFLIGKNTVQAKKCLDKCYPDSAPLIPMVEKWFADFERGRTSTDDAERLVRPSSAVFPEYI